VHISVDAVNVMAAYQL